MKRKKRSIDEIGKSETKDRSPNFEKRSKLLRAHKHPSRRGR